MTTTAIITNTANSGDGFDLAANGDSIVVAPNVFLGGLAGDGVHAQAGGYVTDNGEIFGSLDGISLNAGGDPGDYSEVWIGAQGSVQSSYSNWAITIGGGPFTIQNYGLVSSSGLNGDAVGTNGAGTLVNHGTITGPALGVEDLDQPPATTIFCRITA